MSPYQHGEVFVTDDGAETDLGHYERFIDEDLNQFSNLTTGKVYWNVLNKERRGQTVQVIPHVTNEIKDFIYNVGRKSNADVVITEIGGTTGDIESQPSRRSVRYRWNRGAATACLFTSRLCRISKAPASTSRSRRSIPSGNCSQWGFPRISSSCAATIRWMRKSAARSRFSAM